FGLATDQLIVGDWKGDGRAQLGVPRPDAGGALALELGRTRRGRLGARPRDSSGSGGFDASDTVFNFGQAGDTLVAGRFNPAIGSRASNPTGTGGTPGDGEFDSFVTISNVKGTYTGTQTIKAHIDNLGDLSYRASVTVLISDMTDAGDHVNFTVSGTLTVGTFTVTGLPPVVFDGGVTTVPGYTKSFSGT